MNKKDRPDKKQKEDSTKEVTQQPTKAADEVNNENNSKKSKKTAATKEKYLDSFAEDGENVPLKKIKTNKSEDNKTTTQPKETVSKTTKEATKASSKEETTNVTKKEESKKKDEDNKGEEQKSIQKKEDGKIVKKMMGFFHKENDFICPVCLKFIVSAVNFRCGHTFCETCITDYLLLFKKCPLCTKNLRKSHFNYSILLDSLIERYISTTHSSEHGDYQKRLKSHKEWNKNKKKPTFEVGEKLDVRNKDYIWCIGTIKRISRRPESHHKILSIHFDGLPPRSDEEIKENSPRLSPLGFYTSRTDIPKYDLLNQNPALKNNIVYKGQPISEYYYHEMESRGDDPKNYDENDSSSCSEGDDDENENDSKTKKTTPV